ncbi:MAG: hypothetical protein PUE08_02940 [Eubacteriales bacterium]|nr:hypothetical protein [Eubacteriales bacterium]
MRNAKVYVPVTASFDENGRTIPQTIQWENGHIYHIDKVTNTVQSSAMKPSGQGDRYTIFVNRQQSYIFFERTANLMGNIIGRCFVERKYV